MKIKDNKNSNLVESIRSFHGELPEPHVLLLRTWDKAGKGRRIKIMEALIAGIDTRNNKTVKMSTASSDLNTTPLADNWNREEPQEEIIPCGSCRCLLEALRTGDALASLLLSRILSYSRVSVATGHHVFHQMELLTIMVRESGHASILEEFVASGGALLVIEFLNSKIGQFAIKEESANQENNTKTKSSIHKTAQDVLESLKLLKQLASTGGRPYKEYLCQHGAVKCTVGTMQLVQLPSTTFAMAARDLLLALGCGTVTASVAVHEGLRLMMVNSSFPLAQQMAVQAATLLMSRESIFASPQMPSPRDNNSEQYSDACTSYKQDKSLDYVPAVLSMLYYSKDSTTQQIATEFVYVLAEHHSEASSQLIGGLAQILEKALKDFVYARKHLWKQNSTKARAHSGWDILDVLERPSTPEFIQRACLGVNGHAAVDRTNQRHSEVVVGCELLSWISKFSEYSASSVLCRSKVPQYLCLILLAPFGLDYRLEMLAEKLAKELQVEEEKNQKESRNEHSIIFRSTLSRFLGTADEGSKHQHRLKSVTEAVLAAAAINKMHSDRKMTKKSHGSAWGVIRETMVSKGASRNSDVNAWTVMVSLLQKAAAQTIKDLYIYVQPESLNMYSDPHQCLQTFFNYAMQDSRQLLETLISDPEEFLEKLQGQHEVAAKIHRRLVELLVYSQNPTSKGLNSNCTSSLQRATQCHTSKESTTFLTQGCKEEMSPEKEDCFRGEELVQKSFMSATSVFQPSFYGGVSVVKTEIGNPFSKLKPTSRPSVRMHSASIDTKALATSTAKKKQLSNQHSEREKAVGSGPCLTARDFRNLVDGVIQHSADAYMQASYDSSRSKPRRVNSATKSSVRPTFSARNLREVADGFSPNKTGREALRMTAGSRQSPLVGGDSKAEKIPVPPSPIQCRSRNSSPMKSAHQQRPKTHTFRNARSPVCGSNSLHDTLGIQNHTSTAAFPAINIKGFEPSGIAFAESYMLTKF